jgi:hypothetical protein
VRAPFAFLVLLLQASYVQAQTCTVSVNLPDVLNISPEGGAEIASAILAVLTVAFCFRMLIQAVRSNGGDDKESEG